METSRILRKQTPVFNYSHSRAITHTKWPLLLFKHRCHETASHFKETQRLSIRLFSFRTEWKKSIPQFSIYRPSFGSYRENSLGIEKMFSSEFLQKEYLSRERDLLWVLKPFYLKAFIRLRIKNLKGRSTYLNTVFVRSIEIQIHSFLNEKENTWKLSSPWKLVSF